MIARLLTVWLVLATALAFFAPFARVPFLAPVAMAAQVGALAYFYVHHARFRAAVEAVDLRLIVLAHALRAPIGAAFLFELGRGALPAAFATTAGYGDIIAGFGALAVAAFAQRPLRPASRSLVLAWNAVGMLDILLVIATAQSLAIIKHDPLMLSAFSRFPYPMLVLGIVPLVVATHAYVFVAALAGGRVRHAE